MPQFKRFVAYLYYYENDTKEYLAGFARVEMRGGICRLEIHLKGTEYAGQEAFLSVGKEKFWLFRWVICG